MTTEETSLRQRREATVREHIDAENRHDPDAVVAAFSSSRASYDVPAMGEAGQPADAPSVRAMWVGLVTAFPDLHIEPGPLYHGDNHIFVEIRMTGTQQADFAGSFRSEARITAFCRIRSYLSTMRKQGHAILHALAAAFAGRPLPVAWAF